MGACPDCGTTNPAGARFCNGCGSALAEAHAPRVERKTVTVLFVDLVGFTARAEPLDPEDVLALARPFHDLLRRSVETYGGTLARIVGDAGMAVFGYPSAHEDDPERAVRAAIAIMSGLRDLDLTHPGSDLHARAGINTTEAVVTYGSALEDADDLMGDGVNAAARIQAVAPADGIVVGQATRDATARTIAYADLPPVELRGRTEPMRLFRVVGPIARVAADRPDGTPLVGRDAELGLMVRAFERAMTNGATETVTIVADPGLGKSRLVRELARHVDALPDLVTWRAGRCLPYGEGAGLWALGEIVRSQAGILDTDDPGTRAAKLDAILDEPDPALRRWMADRLAPLAGIPTASEPPTQEEAFAAWRRFLGSIAAAGPTVLVVEDLHWADAALVSFLESLADAGAGLPLLLVATARPEVAERHPAWLGRPRRATVLPLAALGEAEMRTLVGAVLGGASAELEGAVVGRAAGSPLFAEQIAAMLRDRAAAGDPAAPDDAIPASIHALLAARLDALPPDRRALLLDASVVGKRFWPGALTAVSGAAPADLDAALADLSRRELVRRVVPSSMEGQEEFAFWHALVRDVAYTALTRPDRLARHRAVAAWVAELPGTAEGAASEIVAAHLERALELADALGDADAANAVRADLVGAHLASADHAMRTEVPRALGHLRRALDLLPPDDPRRPGTLALEGRLHNSMGDVPAALTALLAAADGYRAAGEPRRAAGIAPFLAIALAFAGEVDRANAVLAEARAVLAPTPGPELVTVVAEQAIFAMNGNRLDLALALAEEAIALADRLGVPRPHRALHARGWVRYPADPDGAEADFRASVDEAVAAGRIMSAAGALQNRAIARGTILGPAAALEGLEEAEAFRAAHGMPVMPLRFSRLDALELRGDWDTVLAEAAPLRDWAQEHGDAWGTWSVDLVVASIRLARGERVGRRDDLLERGRAIGQQAFAGPVTAEAALAEGDREGACAVLAAVLAELGPGEVERPGPFVRACVRAGDTGLARRVLALGTTPAALARAETLAAGGMVAEADGDPAAAADLYARAADGFARLGAAPEEAHAREGLGRCRAALGEEVAAGEALRAARELWARIGAPPRVAAIEALLAEA